VTSRGPSQNRPGMSPGGFDLSGPQLSAQIVVLSLETTEGPRADNPSRTSSSRKNFAACTAPATTPSPTSPNCSKSPDRPCIAHWQNRTRLRHPCSRRRFSQARSKRRVVFAPDGPETPKGRLLGKQPKLKPRSGGAPRRVWHAGKHTSAELAELFSVARFTVYRAVQRAGAPEPVRAARRA